MEPDLTRERWRRLSTLYDQLADLPARDQQARLDELGRHDPELQSDLRALLAAGTEADRVIEGAEAEIRETLQHIDIERESADGGDRTVRAGPWCLIREIARGGMGVVFLGEREDGQFEQRVAVKLLKRGLDTDEVLARFLRERQILARLQHPNIATLIDGGATADGRPYFAMEYVDGVPVTSYCDGRGLPIEDRLRLFMTACRAVSFAHRNLVVHRDLKPSNILITADGELKLLDFGIAKLLIDAEPGGGLTRTEARVLTPAYAAPEQVRGEPATTATDVYGLGTVLYELLTGKRARELPTGAPLGAVQMAVETEPPAMSAVVAGRARPDDPIAPGAVAARRGTTPARLRRQLQGELDAIAATALSNQPDRRYGSVDALARDIERWLNGLPIQAQRTSAGYRVRKFIARHRIAVAAAALVLLSLVGGLVSTLWQARAAAQEARKAEEVTRFLTSIFQVSDPSQSRGERVTAREILDAGATRIEHELTGQPDVQAILLGTIGEIYRQLGLLDRAAPLVEKSLAETRARHGAGSPETTTAILRWGRLLVDRGEFQRAAQVLEEGLAIRRALDGPRSAGVAEMLSAVASAYTGLGRLEDAERLHVEALAIARAVFGDEHLRTAEHLHNVADRFVERHALPEAEGMLRRALAVRRRLAGDDHPETITSLFMLASVLRDDCRYAEAHPLFQQVLLQRRRALGPDHPEVARTLDAIAILLESMGRFGESLSVAREALDIRRRTLAPEHPDLAVSVNTFALTSYRLGSFEEAERGFRDALDLWRRRLGEGHSHSISALNNLGMTLRERGNLREAESFVRRALDLRRKLHGESSQEVAQSHRNLGLVLTDSGALRAADVELGRAVALSRTVYTPGHPRLAEALVALGRLRLAQNRPRDAEPLLREALTLRIRQPGEESPQAAEARMYLGSAVCDSDRVGEAHALIAAAAESFTRQFGAEDWRVADAHMHRAACLLVAGRRDEARAEASASLATFRMRLGDRHYLSTAARRLLTRIE